jgi:hypothetical protein
MERNVVVARKVNVPKFGNRALVVVVVVVDAKGRIVVCTVTVRANWIKKIFSDRTCLHLLRTLYHSRNVTVQNDYDEDSSVVSLSQLLLLFFTASSFSSTRDDDDDDDDARAATTCCPHESVE